LFLPTNGLLVRGATKSVDAYITAAPMQVRGKLVRLRAAIKEAAPAATEGISYGIPYYSYKGPLAYFRLAKGHIGLYIPPPVIEEHLDELSAYGTARATVRFPLKGKLPAALIKKLVKARMRTNEAGS
jgi:uncharacterized protein YdhG (YjbR/CyaY superfamily)